MFRDYPCTIDLGRQGECSEDHAKAGADQLTDDNQQGIRKIRAPLLIVDKHTCRYGRVEMSTSNATEDQDSGI